MTTDGTKGWTRTSTRRTTKETTINQELQLDSTLMSLPSSPSPSTSPAIDRLIAFQAWAAEKTREAELEIEASKQRLAEMNQERQEREQEQKRLNEMTFIDHIKELFQWSSTNTTTKQKDGHQYQLLPIKKKEQ